MWSLADGQDVLNKINPAFSENIVRHVRNATLTDPFHVSANTDPRRRPVEVAAGTGSGRPAACRERGTIVES